MMTTKTDKTTAPVLDIETLPGGRNILHDVPPLARQVLTREVLAFVAERSALKRAEITRASHELWARVREVVYDEESGRTLGQALASPQVSPVLLLLETALDVLLAAGALECTLVERRAAIDRELAMLRGEPSPDVKH